MTARTTNLAEALYLLTRGNRLVRLSLVVDLPQCTDECAFLFSGEHAEDDHFYYISHNMEQVDLTALPLLFGAIEDVLELPLEPAKALV
jgi:hypothetical protein